MNSQRSIASLVTVLAVMFAGISPAHAQSGLTLGEEPAGGSVLDLGAQRGSADSADEASSSSGSSGSSAASGSTLDPISSSLQTPSGGSQDRETYGAWQVTCADNGQCAMAQIGMDSEGTPVLEMVIRKLPEPVVVGDRSAIAVLDVVTPLGVVLSEGLGMTIDTGRNEAAPFQICTEQGCLVREPIDDELIQRLKRGATANLTMVAANQGPVESTISLTGFTKAYDAVK